MILKPRKVPVMWKLREDVVKKIQEEAASLGFPSMPAFVNFHFYNRYFVEKRGQDEQ